MLAAPEELQMDPDVWVGAQVQLAARTVGWHSQLFHRVCLSSQFSGEPTSYTRFSIARQTDGDNSHVEMNLAADEEDGGEIGKPEHLHASMPPPRRNGKNLCLIIMAAVVLLLIGKEGWEATA